MLTEYFDAAMRHAHYELMEDVDFWGEIPEFDGLWGSGKTLEACRDALRSALEDWVLVGVALHHELPVVDGLGIPIPEVA